MNTNPNHIPNSKLSFRKYWSESIKIENKSIEFKLETGSEANILPERIYNQLGTEAIIEETLTKLQAYCGNMITPIGKCYLTCSYKNEVRLEPFYIKKRKFRGN